MLEAIIKVLKKANSLSKFSKKANIINARKWEVFYNVPSKILGIRKLRTHGIIKYDKNGSDYTDYRTKIMFSVCCTRAELSQLKNDIQQMLDYAEEK